MSGRDEDALYAATEEAYADHFLFSPSTMEQWRLDCVDHPRFEPSLWLVAWAGDEVAGETLAFTDQAEVYVDSLSVRRRWRGCGLGLALLTRAFALALYLRAGMRVERRDEAYAKELRE